MTKPVKVLDRMTAAALVSDIDQRAAGLADAVQGKSPLVSIPQDAVRASALRTLTQDPLGVSKRVGAAIMALLTGLLAIPEVQVHLVQALGNLAGAGPWAPVITAGLAAALSSWSKASDPRPARNEVEVHDDDD